MRKNLLIATLLKTPTPLYILLVGILALVFSPNAAAAKKNSARQYSFFKNSAECAHKKEPSYSKEDIARQISKVKLPDNLLNKSPIIDLKNPKPEVIITAATNRLIAGKIKIANITCPAWTNGWSDDHHIQIINGKKQQVACKEGNTCQRAGDTPVGFFKANFVPSAKSTWVVSWSIFLKPLFKTHRDRLFIHSRGFTSLPPSQWDNWRSAGCPVVPPRCMEALRQLGLARKKTGFIVEVRGPKSSSRVAENSQPLEDSMLQALPFGDGRDSERLQAQLREEFTSRGPQIIQHILSREVSSTSDSPLIGEFTDYLIRSFVNHDQPQNFSAALSEIRNAVGADSEAVQSFVDFIQDYEVEPEDTQAITENIS